MNAHTIFMHVHKNFKIAKLQLKIKVSSTGLGDGGWETVAGRWWLSGRVLTIDAYELELGSSCRAGWVWWPTCKSSLRRWTKLASETNHVSELWD